ncbi:Crp/Fnr family transcriptional regulator [Treponema socranskii]|uniref:Crp/Fnr family transcriptional regulator n=1 Tax=Treponema socranskii TaxID=53419 RepID=UPI003611FF80
MPKAMQYTKGSIVYFEGDKDERIFILQKGILVLTTTDVETHQPVTEQVKNGEFFGVKSALGRFPREETATALTDCVSIALTIQEFEQIFSSNKEIIMKMLRVFSNQLRLIHKKTEAILNNVPEDQQTGMIAVAKSFYNDEEYLSCCDICVKFLSLYPNTAKKDEVAKLYADAKLRNTKIKEKIKSSDTTEEDEEASGALKQFALPAFKRFAKQYKPGNVIISEFEPGNSFYLIQSGRVQLVKCVNGAKKNLDIMKPGEFFGEMAILDNSPRSATCVAIGNVECLEFNKENFQLLIMGNPQIAIILLKLFCKRIYDQRRRLRTLAIKDVQARIADVFLMFDEMNPSVNANDRQRKFNVSAADVAHWAGLSPEATRDEINKFVEKRKIEVYDNYIIIDNIADMKRIVDTRSGLSEQK